MTEHYDFATEIIAGVYLGGNDSRTQIPGLPQTINLDLHNPATWSMLLDGSNGTDAGINVTEESALTYAPVWQAVNLISSAVACLPFHHYRYLPSVSATASERMRSTQDYLVSMAPSGDAEPNDYQTAVQFWESFVADALLWNNAYALITFDRAMRPIRLSLLAPDRTSCEYIDGQLWYTTEWTAAGQVKALFPWEVLHIRGLSAKGCKAPPFIECARNSIALGLAQQKFAARFFRNGGRRGGILELPIGMGKAARDTVEEGFRKTYEGNDEPFKTFVAREGVKFHEAQFSPDDSQMVEGTAEQVRMIARWFGLSPSLLGLAGSTSYNSKEQDNQAFLDHCLRRWLRKIEQECALKLLADNRRMSEFFRYDTTDLLTMNGVQQAQVDQIHIQSRVKNPNEVRAKLGLLPYEGGDEYVNPNTTKDGGPTPDALSSGQNDSSPPVDIPKRDWRVDRVLYNLTHVARQKSRNHRSFYQWLEGGAEAQRAEWNEIAAGEPEPPFIAQIIGDFNRAIETATPETLPQAVEAITLTYERPEHGT